VSKGPGRQRGVTLIELMVVAAIVAILAVVAYPSYTDYVVRSQRQAAKNMLVQVADRQEQFFLDNKTYASSLAQLGYAAAQIGIRRDGQITTAGDGQRTYRIQLLASGGTVYTVQAVPQLAQQQRDTACGTLLLQHTGERIQQGSGKNCW